jgi:putative ABC transport system permease protein
MRRRSRAERLYRLLLRLFPSEFRGDFGDEMSTVFGDERDEAAAVGRLGLARLWWRTLRGFARTAPREHADVLMRDARYGLRLMRQHSLTTGAAMLAIALGVGANTAMFTVVNAVLLQLPFDDPGRLVSVHLQNAQGSSVPIPLAQFRRWTGRIDAVESVAGYSMYSPVLTGSGAPDRVRLECVSAGMFPMLGVAPVMGRTFLHEEDSLSAPRVMVASYTFWATQLGRDARNLGRVLTLDGAPVTVIGVMPKEFDGPRALRRIDGWIPLSWCLESSNRVEGRPAATVGVYARLKRDVTAAQAATQMESAIEGATSPQERTRVQLEPLRDQIYDGTKEPLLALFGAAGFVLLIACANVASLLIGRADARRRELAVRVALGCSRARIVRQLLTESLLFAVCGGAVGLLITHWSLGTLVAMMPGSIRRIDHIAVDGTVLVASVGLSAVTTLVCGLWPAMYASRVDPGASLKESALLTTPSRRRMRGVLIVIEVALSVALLTGAGLLIKTFLHLRPADPGFEPEGKLAATISLPRSRYADGPSRTAFMENLRRRLAQRPGVEAVVATSYVPLSGFISIAEVQHPAAGSPSVRVYAPHVTADYFKEMSIPILRGRGFTELDGPGAGVAIANEAMARTLWPGQDPLGQQLVCKTSNGTSTKTIVGIARNLRDTASRLTSRSELYVPFADEPVATLRIVVKTRQTVEQMAPVIRQEVAAIDPLLPLSGDVVPVASMVARSFAQWRFAASLLALFAGIAATLAAIGLFAVVAGWVTERTPEVGVRMALGANRGRVLRLFLARGALLTAFGVAFGVGLAALTSRFLSAWLVDASPLDPPTFAAATAAMGGVCLLATYIAARRAAKIDPLIALRS